MADVDNQERVHQEGTEHIRQETFNNNNEGASGTATSAPTTKPEPIVPAKPPASNPGANDPTGGIAKDAGGVSSSAHVESPAAASTQKRKSIVGQLKGLFLGGDKKEREASEAGTAKQGGTTTGAIAAGAAGTGVAASTGATTGSVSSPSGAGATGADTVGSGPAVSNPDTTKSGDKTYLNYSDGQTTATTTEAAPKSTTEQVKETVTGDKDANTGTATASNTGGPATDTTAPGTEPGSTADKVENGPEDTSGEDSHKPPAPAGGKPTENREAIPTAGGKKLGEEHWGESKIVPDNPKPATDSGVASAEGQPTSEVKDNTAKNTGGATSGPHDTTKEGDKPKGKFMDKVKDKLPFGKKD